jgi:hypothetical protein
MALEELLAQLSVDARWSAAELRHTAEGAIVQRGATRVLLVGAERVEDLRVGRAEVGVLIPSSAAKEHSLSLLHLICHGRRLST